MVDPEYTWASPHFMNHPTESVSLLAVDPGLNGTGWALWNAVVSTTTPVAAGVIVPPRGKTLGVRMAVVLEELDGIASRKFPLKKPGYSALNSPYDTHLAIEMPAFQSGATRQMGWQTGDLQKLTLLVGYLVNHHWARVTLITPAQWKGQLPKSVVEERIRGRLGNAAVKRLGIKTHAFDAVGIGMHIRGEM